MQLRSFTVPQMLSLPMFPPLNSKGETMKPSVDIASLPSPMFSTAASSAVNCGFEKCALNTRSISSEVCFPPAPCASVTVFSAISIYSFMLLYDKVYFR